MAAVKAGNNEKRLKLKYLKDLHSADDSQDSVDSNDRPSSILRMTREDVLATLGYRSERTLKPLGTPVFGQRSDLCHRCGKKVYPVERMDVGELYHRGCLKCFACGLQLSLKTFHRVVSNGSKAVYCKTHIPKLEKSINRDAMEMQTAVAAQKKASEKVFKPYEQSAYSYDPAALEFEHARQIKQRQKVRRRSSLKTHADFEKFGVYAAQADLEKRHRQEEDQLYHQFFEERQRLLRNLEEVLAKEKEHTVKELIAWFEQQGSPKPEQDDGVLKIEQYYHQQRETRIKELLERMAFEEQAAVSRMIDKHSQEMLFMIEEKDRQVGESLEDHHRGTTIGRDAEELISYVASSKSNQNQSTTAKENVIVEEDEEEEEEDEGEKEEEDETLQGNVQENEEKEKEEEKEEKEEEEEDEEEEEEDEANLETEDFRNRDVDKKEIDVAVAVAVATEMPTDIEMHQMKTMPLKEKTMENKETQQHEAIDVETQTRPPRPQVKNNNNKATQKSPDLKPESPRAAARGSKENLTSPAASKRISSSGGSAIKKPDSQFQIFISTERIPNEDLAKKKPAKSVRPLGSKSKFENDEDEDEEDEDEDDECLPLSQQPQAQPPTCRKSKLYKSPEIFKEFDQRAIEESKRDPTSFTDLVRRLSQKCQTDLQKVRAIFRWITAKDLNKIKFTDNQNSDTPMGLLRGIKYGTESYHNLLKRLCSYAGLHCEVIDGYSKGAGYRPGSKFKGHRFRNQWTAVWVDDSWRFVNCNWGSRHVKKAGNDHLTYKIDEFYFLTDPQDHIYQHFPDDQRWQLLKRPITIEAFVRLPVVKSPFFNNRLSFVMKTESILKAIDGRVELRLQMRKLMSYATKLKFKNSSGKDEILADRSLIRTVDNEVVFLVNLPSPGQFYWDVFVDSHWLSENMDNACSFLIHCSSVSSGSRLSYPQIGCFGRTPFYEENEISGGIDPLIVTTSGEIAVAVKVPNDALRLSHTLRFWNRKEQTLKDCDHFALLMSRVDSTATYIVRCPQKGNYVLSLLAVDPKNVSGSKQQIFYRYLIECQTALLNALPFPHASSKWNDCRLIEPFNGELLSNTQMQFRVESKMATEVLVSVNGTWTALQKNRNVWQAVVPVGDKSGKLCLYGRFEVSKDKYIPLWEYVVKEKTAFDEVRTLYKYL